MKTLTLSLFLIWHIVHVDTYEQLNIKTAKLFTVKANNLIVYPMQKNGYLIIWTTGKP